MINLDKRNFIFNIPKLFLAIFSMDIVMSWENKKKKFIIYENWILKTEDFE